MSSPEVKLILSLIDQTKEGLAQAGLNVKSYGDTVEQEAKKIQVSWKDVASSVSGVITAGFSLYQMWDAVETRQVAVLRATNTLEDAQRRQNNALEKLNEEIADHGANSEQAAKAQDAYEAACKDVQVAQERLGVAQSNLNEAIARTIFVLPSLITLVDRAKAAYVELKTAVDASQISLAGLGSILGVVGATFATCYAASAIFAPKMREFAETLDISTEAAREAQQELLGIDLSVKELGVTVDENAKGLTDYASKWDDVRETVSDASEVHYSFATALGVSEKEVESLAERLGMTAEELEEFVVQTGMSAEELKTFADEMDTLKEHMDTLKGSFFDIFTEESQEFQADLQAMGQTAYEVMTGMQPDFAAVNTLIQDFADRWGLTWDEAEKIVMEKVEEIKATIGTVAPTLEDELVGKAQAAMERFKNCMGEKSTATRDEMRDAMEDMVSSINELISHGLLGEAQALMDTFKEAEPDKMWKMTEDIDAAIESLTAEMEAEFEKMLAAADELSGEERDLMIQRAEQMRDEYLARIEQLKEWKAQILFRMQLETQGYMDAEINTIMSGLTTLQALSGGKWNDIVALWEKCLAEAKGDIANAIAAIQAIINSLKGTSITITTTYVTRYVTEGGERIPYYVSPEPEKKTTKTTQEPYKTPPSLPPSIRQMGLEYVPYTGYLAMLHRGEAILTVEQAERWRRGERNISIGPIYVGSIASDMDIRETARKLARYVAQEERRLGLD